MCYACSAMPTIDLLIEQQLNAKWFLIIFVFISAFIAWLTWKYVQHVWHVFVLCHNTVVVWQWRLCANVWRYYYYYVISYNDWGYVQQFDSASLRMKTGRMIRYLLWCGGRVVHRVAFDQNRTCIWTCMSFGRNIWSIIYLFIRREMSMLGLEWHRFWTQQFRIFIGQFGAVSFNLILNST